MAEDLSARRNMGRQAADFPGRVVRCTLQLEEVGDWDDLFTGWYPLPPSPLSNGIMGLAGDFCFGL